MCERLQLAREAIELAASEASIHASSVLRDPVEGQQADSDGELSTLEQLQRIHARWNVLLEALCHVVAVLEFAAQLLSAMRRLTTDCFIGTLLERAAARC